MGILLVALFLFGSWKLAGFLIETKIRPVRYARAADAAYAKATQTIDPEELRAWALAAISRYPITNKYSGSRAIPKSEIPVQILQLWPTEPYVYIDQQETNSEKCVDVFWDGDQHKNNWWLTIGSTNFLQFSNSEVSCSYFQRAVWARGIYYNRYPR